MLKIEVETKNGRCPAHQRGGGGGWQSLSAQAKQAGENVRLLGLYSNTIHRVIRETHKSKALFRMYM